MIDQTNQPIDYADAVASGIAATNLTTKTTGNVPEALDVPDPSGTPQWSSQPSQSDFGQVDVRRGNYNTGMVPTVNVQMPFAALANRQQALGQRKAALEKQVADFDLYSKVGSPDARYAQAYSRYATTEMDLKLKEYADAMHGGDTRSAVRDIATNPEAKRMWDGWSRNVQAVADENKKWMAINDERLAKHFSGEATIRDPKALEAMMRFSASVDENRTPIGADGAPLDAGSFVNTARQAVPEIQKIQYMDEVLGDSMKNALQTITNTTIEDRTEGGNIVLTKTETKQYEDAINAYVESDKRFVEDYFDGDKEEAKKFVRAFYPISTVEDKEFKGVSYAPVGRGGSGNDIPAGALTVDYAPLPQEAFAMYDDKGKVVEGKSALGQGAKEMEFAYLPIFDVVSGQGRTAQPRMFNTMAKGGGGKNIYVIPERIVDINGKKFIFGKEAGETGASKEADRFRSQRDDIQDFKKLKSVVVPYEGNEGRLNSYFPWLTPEAIDEGLSGSTPRRKQSPGMVNDRAQSSKPKKVVQNGVTYTLDEATGEYK
jgi:hypothetical protein